MRLKTLFVSVALASVALVAGLVVAGWSITARLEKVYQAQQRAQSAAREVADLLVVTHEYALFSEDRAKQQWRERHANLVYLLEVGKNDVVPIADEAHTEAQRLNENFQRLLEAASSTSELRRHQTALLLSQLLTSAQLLSDSVYLWSSETGVQRRQAEQLFHIVAMMIPAALLLIIAALTALLYRRILYPLATLNRAVQAVARGDLSVRSATPHDDELGDLSRTFDAMAVDLVRQLRSEVASRSAAEHALARANDDLAARQALLTQILDTSSVAIFLIDNSGTIIHANQRMAEMFRLSLAELIGKNYLGLLHPSEQAIGQQRIQALLENRLPSINLERRYWRADHTEFWGHLTGKCFIDGSGEQRGLVGVIADITDRRLSEVKLLNIKAIVDSTDDAVISKTLTEIITSWNPGAEKMFGYGADEAIGSSIQMLIPADRQGEETHILARIAQGERIEHFETVRRHKQGRLIDVSVTLSPIADETGKIVGASKIARDITATKRVEVELTRHREHLEKLVEERTVALSVAKEAAETANRAKSIFLTNMSHELRTPMNAIMGMTAIALRRTTDPQQIEPLTRVTQAAQRLLGLINDILDISRIEAERLSLENVDFTLGSVLDNLRSLLEQSAADKGLRLQIDASAELAGLALRGDDLRLGQILFKLAGNAIKFTAEGSVAVRVTCVAEHPGNVVLRFEVDDTGIGISSEDQQRLFTVFEQGDGSLTRRYGGTGLGLAISKRLVQMMAGQIGVDSAPGSGSRFWFTARIEKRLGVEPTRQQTSRGAADGPEALEEG